MYRIHTGATRFHDVVDAAGGVADYRTRLINWPAHGGANQQWLVEPIGIAPSGNRTYGVRSAQDPRFC